MDLDLPSTDYFRLSAFQNRSVDLYAERAAYLPDYETLVAADLHLGKAETFQAKGIPLPSGSDAEDLKLLKTLIEKTGAKKLVIAGDVFHSPKYISRALRDLLIAWLDEARPCQVHFALGNHDRNLTLESHSHLTLCDEYPLDDELMISHHPPAEDDEGFRICGHLHPVVQLRSRNDRLRLQCFVHSPNGLILPAFSSLAGGYEVTPSATSRVYAIADGQVLPLFS